MNASELLTGGLMNAALATLLAVAGWLLTRLWPNPHVASIVWLAVLLKLVTPPVAALPLPFDGGRIDIGRTSNSVPFDGEVRTERSGLEIENDAADVVAEKVSFPMTASEISRFPLREHSPREPVEASRPVELDGGRPSFSTQEVTSVPTGPSTLEPLTREEASAAVSAAPVADSLSTDELPWKSTLLAAWLIGTVLFALTTLCRIVRFHRTLRRAAIVDHEMQRAAVGVAARLGLKRCPAVRSVAANVGPLVWAGALRPLVIVPRPLWEALGDDERETLLAHELAHVVRRDHWVRRFEAVVLVLYWWLPTAWLAVRRREVAAETCCDALVLNHYPDRPQAYAEALLTAVTVLSTSRTPALANGLGRKHELKERLTMIAHDRVPTRPGRITRWGMLLIAALTLAVGATLKTQHAAQASDATNESEHTAPASDPAPQDAKAPGDAAAAVDEILFFHAEWSGPSQKMKSLVEKLKQEGLPFRIVDVDREKELAKSMHVNSIPAFVVMRNGKEIDRTVGAMSEEALRDFANRYPVADRGDPLSHESRKKIIDGLITVVQREKQPADVKAQAMRSLGTLAKGTDDEQRIETVLVEAAEKSQDDAAKLGAAEALHGLGSPKGVEQMWQILENSNNNTTRWSVVEQLQEASAIPPSSEALIILAQYSIPFGNRAGNLRAKQLLLRAVQDADGVRRVIKALETLEGTSAAMEGGLGRGGLPGMEEMSGDGPNPARNVLLSLLSEARPTTDEIAAVLVESLSDKDADIREAAAKALGNAEPAAGRGGAMPAFRGSGGAMRGGGSRGTRNASPFGRPARGEDAFSAASTEPEPAPSDETVRKELLEPLIAAGKDEQATPESRIAALTALARLSKTKAEKEQAAEVMNAMLEGAIDDQEKQALTLLLQELTEGESGLAHLWIKFANASDDEAASLLLLLNEKQAIPPNAKLVGRVMRVCLVALDVPPAFNGPDDVPRKIWSVGDEFFARLVARPEGVERLIEAMGISEEPKEHRYVSDTPVRDALLKRLTNIQPTSPDVAKVLAKALSHEDPAIRTAAATALGNYSASNDATKEDPFGNHAPRTR